MYKKFRTQSEESIKKTQLKKMQRVVNHAYENSDFYRSYYQSSGFHPDMLRTYDDIQKIPIVKRIMLKSAPSESILTRKDTSNLHCHTTTGSSGTPVKFYFDSNEALQKNLGFIRAYSLMGVKLTDVTVALRDPVDIRGKALYERFGLLRYDYQNIYDGIDVIYESLRQKYNSIDVLKGMPSDLVNLAYAVRSSDEGFPKVKRIISDSEVLDEASRAFIEDTFGVSVLDTYACVEAGCIAFQLPGSSKYFMNEDQVLLESISGDRLESDAIVTNLRNTTFPIIRYQIGDMIDFGDGNSDLPNMRRKTIDGIYGKYLDFIVLPDKSIVSPHVPKQELTHDLPHIKKFQVKQVDLDSIEVIVEPEDGYSKETESEILRRMDNAFKGQMSCKVTIDPQLSEKTSRKFKCIDSSVAQNFLSGNPI